MVSDRGSSQLVTRSLESRRLWSAIQLKQGTSRHLHRQLENRLELDGRERSVLRGEEEKSVSISIVFVDLISTYREYRSSCR
jgi:hypothetical protein